MVKIGESKFGKQKYHQDHCGKVQWVFGGIVRGNGRTFLVAVHDSSPETLIGLIKQWILLRMAIISDCWVAYSTLCDEGYTRFTVSQSHLRVRLLGLTLIRGLQF